MAKKITNEDLDLLDELGLESSSSKSNGLSAREQRIIAGFEEIERFLEEHGRLPQHGENRDIFERIYAVRLDRLRDNSECLTVLHQRDPHGLLEFSQDLGNTSKVGEDAAKYHAGALVNTVLSDEELLAALSSGENDENDIMELKHVRTSAEKRAAEEIAQREVCATFWLYKPLFIQLKEELKNQIRTSVPCVHKAQLEVGDFYIIQGQIAYIAGESDAFINGEGRMDCRLSVIFDNGTESNMLRRSFQKRLWEDDQARKISNLDHLGPLFSNLEEPGDKAVGFIYVLRSNSEDEFITQNRHIIHKIGITKGSVKQRVANAAKDPTYLLAEVEIVESFKVSNLDLMKLEQLLHKFFASARLDLELKDRFGFEVTPREWFLVPLPVIQEAIQKLIDGTISEFYYHTNSAEISKI